MSDNEKFDMLLDKIGVLTEQMNKMQSDMTEMKSDMIEMKSDMTEMKSDMIEMKSDMTEMKSDIAGLKTDMTEVKSRVAKIDLTIENEIRVNIQRVAEGHLDLSRNFQAAMRPSNEVEMLAIKVRMLETDVKELKEKIS